MSAEWIGALLALGALVGLRAARAGQPEAPALTLTDGFIALAVGTAGAALAAFYGSPFYGSPSWIADDFDQYCDTLVALRTDLLDPDTRDMRRMPLPGYPAALLARLVGIVDGSTLSALAALSCIGATVSLQARLLGGRLPAILAPLFMVALGPLAQGARELTFYPWQAAVFALGGLAATAALLRPSPGRVALLAAAGGAALSVDQLGVGFGAAWLGLAMVVALSLGRRAHHGLLALGGVFALSFVAASALPQAVEGGAEQPPITLEDRLSMQATLVGIETGGSSHTDAPGTTVGAFPDGFYWGHSRLQDIPRTMARLPNLLRGPEGTQAPPDEARQQVFAQGMRHVVRPLQLLLLIPLLVAFVGLRPARWRTAAALLLPQIPFVGWMLLVGPSALQLAGAHTLADGAQAATVHPKFFLVGLASAPVLWALAVSGLATVGLAVAPTAKALQQRLVAGALVALVLVVVTGILPTPLSPAASWRLDFGKPDWPVRVAWLVASDAISVEQALAAGAPIAPTCDAGLREDAARGLAPGWTGVPPAMHIPRITLDSVDLDGPPGRPR